MLAEYAKKVAASLRPGVWTWYYGYGNLFLAEYVLATGDKSILPELTRTRRKPPWGRAPSAPGVTSSMPRRAAT